MYLLDVRTVYILDIRASTWTYQPLPPCIHTSAFPLHLPLSGTIGLKLPRINPVNLASKAETRDLWAGQPCVLDFAGCFDRFLIAKGLKRTRHGEFRPKFE